MKVAGIAKKKTASATPADWLIVLKSHVRSKSRFFRE